MQEPELAAKTLRAVLHPFKNGVPLSALQREYKSLTGEWIPFRQLGHDTLEAYLASIPGVVRMEGNKRGEVICHAVACSETMPLAQLVARQRSSKKKVGRQVNCQMRLKNTSPVTLAGKPKGTLRQPRSLNSPEEGSKRPVPRPLQGRGTCGVVRPTVESARSALPPAAGSGTSHEAPMQRHVTVVNRDPFPVVEPWHSQTARHSPTPAGREGPPEIVHPAHKKDPVCTPSSEDGVGEAPWQIIIAAGRASQHLGSSQVLGCALNCVLTLY